MAAFRPGVELFLLWVNHEGRYPGFGCSRAPQAAAPGTEQQVGPGVPGEEVLGAGDHWARPLMRGGRWGLGRWEPHTWAWEGLWTDRQIQTDGHPPSSTMEMGSQG